MAIARWPHIQVSSRTPQVHSPVRDGNCAFAVHLGTSVRFSLTARRGLSLPGGHAEPLKWKAFHPACAGVCAWGARAGAPESARPGAQLHERLGDGSERVLPRAGADRGSGECHDAPEEVAACSEAGGLDRSPEQQARLVGAAEVGDAPRLVVAVQLSSTALCRDAASAAGVDQSSLPVRGAVSRQVLPRRPPPGSAVAAPRPRSSRRSRGQGMPGLLAPFARGLRSAVAASPRPSCRALDSAR